MTLQRHSQNTNSRISCVLHTFAGKKREENVTQLVRKSAECMCLYSIIKSANHRAALNGSCNEDGSFLSPVPLLILSLSTMCCANKLRCMGKQEDFDKQKW